MDLTTRYGDIVESGKLKSKYVPRNFSLLFFTPNPYVFFRGAKIEIGRYSRNDEFIEEKKLSGPIDKQIRECLSYILEQTQEEVSYACVTYPERALREAVVNAAYHRGYEPEHCDPIKVHMRPDCIEIISYPGPHPSLKPEQFMEGSRRPSVPARNRRIGNHLKQLKLAEGRYTGVNTIFKTMKKNNNSPPQFEFDSSYFQVTLPSHPKYITHTLLSDVENLVAKGEKKEANEMLLAFIDNHKDMLSLSLVFKLIELYDGNISHPIVQKHTSEFLKADKTNVEHLYERLPLLKQLKLCMKTKPLDIKGAIQTVKALVDKGSTLEELDFVVQTAVRFCYLAKEKSPPVLENLQNGHKLFEAMGATIVQSSGYVAFEFSLCKYQLFNVSVKEKIAKAKNLVSYLLDAEENVTKAMQLTDKESKSYLAKQHRHLGNIKLKLLQFKKATVGDVNDCFERAKELNPEIKINRFQVAEEGRWFYPSQSPTPPRKEERKSSERSSSKTQNKM